MNIKKILSMLAALSAAICSPVYAADYPIKPITMIVPYPPGGPSDNIARALATSMAKTLKQAVVIDNVAGAGGTVGAAKAARSPKDGYYILLQNIGAATTPSLYRSLPYKPDDLAPIGLVATAPSVIIARKDLPANNLSELLAYIRKDPSKINLGHSGVGSASHLCALLVQSSIKQRLASIAYKGAAPAMNDIMGGQFDFMCEQTSVALPFIQSGSVKPMFVTSKKRLSQLSNVPTSIESGLPEVDMGVWHGVYAPKGTPKEVIDKLSAAITEALRDAEVQKRYVDLGVEISPPQEGQPTPLAKLEAAELARWTPIIKTAAEYAD